MKKDKVFIKFIKKEALDLRDSKDPTGDADEFLFKAKLEALSMGCNVLEYTMVPPTPVEWITVSFKLEE